MTLGHRFRGICDRLGARIRMREIPAPPSAQMSRCARRKPTSRASRETAHQDMISRFPMCPVPVFAACQHLRVTDLVGEGAVCNATWCDAVCRSHGLPTRWTEDAWTVARRSPDGYPDAVTLSPAADLRAMLGRIEGGAGCSVKDSFAVLDLEPHGFHVLFEATWIGGRRSSRRGQQRSIGGRCGRPPSSNTGRADTSSTLSVQRCWTAAIFGSISAGRRQVPVLP